MTAADGSFPADAACVDRVTPAANFDVREAEKPLDTLILHYTGMPSHQQARDWLVTAESRVSCHYFIWPDGRIEQLVPEGLRAWHAGVSCWREEPDLNTRSIGIEIANEGHDGGLPDFPAVQIEAVIGLCRDILERRHIPAARVLAHSDVAPARKCDPGEKFPWALLHENGVGHFVLPSPLGSGRYFQAGDRGAPVEAVQSMLSIYGYRVDMNGIFDEATRLAVAAFQRHFRPAKVDGVADLSTIETLHRLIGALPEYN